MGRKSFTLIELLVVIAIIAILAAIVAPNAFRAIEKGKVAATIRDYRAIKSAVMAYYADTGTWPPDCGGSSCPGLLTNDGKPGWNGPYLEKWPRAKWRGTCALRNQVWWMWGGPHLCRYVEITSVPLPSAQAIDREIDGTVYDPSQRWWSGHNTGSVWVGGRPGRRGSWLPMMVCDVWMFVYVD